ncbi:MSL complex subunit 3 isoform X2 [Hydra vulgaris]|uniref:MSL complex subunit 3 isoform X2 n=1 Tax=Hydra vulgaris TaxID=6087 RepID=A0ABM4D395_HYDVU
MAELNKIEKDKDSFTVNDLVLCYEPDPHKARVLYEAKIIDIDQTKDDQGKLVSEFYVHFQGWNKSWDRWVLEDQILTINENSRELQSQLFKKAVQLRKRKPKKSEDDKSSEDEEKVKKEEKLFDIPLVSLDIPKVLATHLEDDCYRIQRKKKLVILPRKPCVTQILNDYLKQCMENPKTYDGRYLSLKIIGEVMEGLNTYFNFFLSTLLLYNFEREQYLTYFPYQDNFDEKMSQKDGLNTSLLTNTLESNEINESNEMDKPSTSSSSKVLDEVISTRKEVQTKVSKKRKEERRKSSREKKPINILQSGVSKNQPQTSEGKNIETTRSEKEKKSKYTNYTSISLNRSRRKINLYTASVKDTDNQCTIENSKTMHRAKLSGCGDDVSSIDIIKGNQCNDINIPTKTDVHFRRSTRSRKSSEEAAENVSQKSVNNDAKAKVKKANETEGFFMVYPLMPNGDSPADIYGVEHFLRLFVKLPVLLAVANIEEEKINIFLKCVSNLLEYLSKRKDLFSIDVYSDAII